jgi:hypothetical protein
VGTYILNLDWQFFQYRHTLDDKLKLKQISHLQQASYRCFVLGVLFVQLEAPNGCVQNSSETIR